MKIKTSGYQTLECFIAALPTGHLVHVILLTDLQIWGCELHKNASGGRALPGPAGGSYSAPPDALAVIRVRERGKGKERVGNRQGRNGAESGDRAGKGERWLDLDICPRAPELLVTPLFRKRTCCRVRWARLDRRGR